MTQTQQQEATPAVGSAARWELLRALGAALVTPPPGNGAVLAALDLPPQTGAEHTDAFVMTAPPHGAIHLGPEGMLGGEGLDRIAGFWRVLGLTAPEDADHLGVLLLLYAELGDAEELAADEPRRLQLRTAREALLHEHLWSWAPGYLRAVAGLGIDSVTAWAELAAEALAAEAAEVGPAPQLPLALRQAPPGLAQWDSVDELLDGLVSPVRSGFILTYRDLTDCARVAGVGLRRGERRFALKAALEQEPRQTLAWLAGHAELWAQEHAATSTDDPVRQWWAARAAESAHALAGATSTSREAS